MKIPRAIKIGGLKYRVKIVKKIDNKDSSGETDTRKLTILLHRDHKREALEVTFMHELFHAINLNLEEKEVEYLAMAFYGLLKDNPRLFKNGR
ncbi:MAG: hypothetical protein AABY22_18445 [Nanoarchaeota archaeon]